MISLSSISEAGNEIERQQLQLKLMRERSAADNEN